MDVGPHRDLVGKNKINIFWSQNSNLLMSDDKVTQTVVCNTIFLQFSMLYIYTHVGDETARVSCPVIRSAIVTWSYVT